MCSFLPMVTLRLPTPADEMHVLNWRNSPSVAPYMYRDDPITTVEHSRWFSGIIQDSESSVIRIAEIDSVAVGLSSLTRIDKRHKSCEWGGYLAPEVSRGAGLGSAVLFLSLKLAFDELELNRVVIEALTNNEQAIGLYESVGFKREGLLRERAWHSTGPIDVFAMSLLASEWKATREILAESLMQRGLIN